MKFDVKKIVALVLTLALVITTITFTAGNTLKAEETDGQDLGPAKSTESVEVNAPEESVGTEASTDQEEPAVEEESLAIQKDNSSKEIYIHNDGHLNYSSFYLVSDAGLVYFEKSNGDKYQSDSGAEGLQGDRVIKDSSKKELGTINLIKHGNGNQQDAGHAMDQYWITKFTPKQEEPKTLSLSLSSNDLRVEYDGNAHSVTVTPSIVEGTTIYYQVFKGSIGGADYQLIKDWSTDVPSLTDVGSCNVLVKAENAEYGTASGKYCMKVSQKHINIDIPNRMQKNAGDPDPEILVTMTELVPKDQPYKDELIKYTLQKTYGDGYIGVKPTGENDQGNYYVHYGGGNIIIVKGAQPLTINVEGAGFEGTYDGQSHGGSVTVTKKDGSAAPSGTVVEYSIDNGKTWTKTAPTVKDVKETTEVLVKASCPDFGEADASYNLIVNPKAVTVKAKPVADVVYGTTMPTDFEADVEGTIGDDTVVYSISKTPAGDAVGDYTVTPSGEVTQGNYTVSYEGTSFKVTESEALTISATGYTGIYNGNTYFGDVRTSMTDGVTVSYSTDNGATWSSVEPSITNVGEIKVIAKAEKTGYKTAQIKYTLKVTKKEVTVTAPTIAITFGEDIPELTATVEGTVGTDTVEYQLTREDGTAVGEYPITFAEPKTADQGNYNVKFVDGKLTIAPVDKIVLAGTNYEDIYDGENHSATVSPSVDGVTYEYKEEGGQWTTTKPEYKDAGEYKYQVRASKEGYTTSDAIDVSVKISPKAIRIVSGSATKTYDGSALRNSEVNVYGLVEGEYFTVAAIGEQTEVGSSDNNVEYEFGEVQNLEATAAKAGNYEVEEVILGTLTVNPAKKPVPVPGDNGGNGNVLVATGNANGGVDMTEIASTDTPLAGSLLDEHCCILHLLLMLAALIMLFWYTTEMKKRQRRIFKLEEEIANKEE